MTTHEILSMANKCNVMPECCTDEALFEFAKQIILQERERCAKLIEDGHFLHDQSPEKLFADQAAKAIRRGT